MGNVGDIFFSVKIDAGVFQVGLIFTDQAPAPGTSQHARLVQSAPSDGQFSAQ